MSIPESRLLIAVLWVSFLWAGALTVLVAVTLDPVRIHDCPGQVSATPMALYTVVFLSAWTFAALASLSSLYFLRRFMQG